MFEEVTVSKGLFSALGIQPPLLTDMQGTWLDREVIFQSSSKNNLCWRQFSGRVWAVSVLQKSSGHSISVQSAS